MIQHPPGSRQNFIFNLCDFNLIFLILYAILLQVYVWSDADPWEADIRGYWGRCLGNQSLYTVWYSASHKKIDNHNEGSTSFVSEPRVPEMGFKTAWDDRWYSVYLYSYCKLCIKISNIAIKTILLMFYQGAGRYIFSGFVTWESNNCKQKLQIDV